MQESSLSIPQWLVSALRDVAMILSGGVITRFITLYLNRKKPFVEVKKTEAETTEITIRARVNEGDSMIRMMNRLDEAGENIDRLRRERDEARLERDLARLELKSNSHFVEQLNRANKLGIQLSDLPPTKKETQ